MSFIRSKLAALFTLALLALGPSITLAQAGLEREGVVLYWGSVPVAVVSEKHALEDMHGIVPNDGGRSITSSSPSSKPTANASRTLWYAPRSVKAELSMRRRST